MPFLTRMLIGVTIGVIFGSWMSKIKQTRVVRSRDVFIGASLIAVVILNIIDILL